MPDYTRFLQPRLAESGVLASVSGLALSERLICGCLFRLWSGVAPVGGVLVGESLCHEADGSDLDHAAGLCGWVS